MRNLIFVSTLFLFAMSANAQWYYGTGEATNLENNIGFDKHQQKIISGSATDPKISAVYGDAGSLLLKTDGVMYVKKDAGTTTNWNKLLDDSMSLIPLIPTASSTQTGLLSSTDWNTFNGKENVLSFSSPLSRATNTISIPVATGSVNGYLSSADWTTFNGKQNDLGFTPENVANKAISTALGTSDTLYPSQKAVKSYVDSMGALKVNGTGTVNRVSKWSATSTITNSTITDDGTTVRTTADLRIDAGKYQYFGDPTVNNSFRVYQNTGSLIVEKRISGAWSEAIRVE